MLELVVIHRPRNGNPVENDLHKAIGSEAQLWSTCLRQILFVPGSVWSAGVVDTASADEIYQGQQAYQFLLEIVCGLRSPLIGETEVQGQFKQFIARLQAEAPHFWANYAHLFQGLLAESKKIRSSHLVNLGSQSYGSLLRRRLVDQEQVTLIGAGQLVADLLPWLKKLKKIDIYTRRTEAAEKLKLGFPQLAIAPLDEISMIQSHSVLVIAAPIPNQRLMTLMSGSQIKNIIDLRGEYTLDGEHLAILRVENYEPLQQLMGEIEKDQHKISQRVRSAEQMIRALGNLFSQKIFLRPGGWEDLCG